MRNQSVSVATYRTMVSPRGFIPGGANGEVHSDPLMWLDALELLFERLTVSGVDLSQIAAIAGSGQQHGSVYLDEGFADTVQALDPGKTLKSQILSHLTRQTAPIWMDTSTSQECAEIAKEVGGNAEVCSRSGSIAIERFNRSPDPPFCEDELRQLGTHRGDPPRQFLHGVNPGGGRVWQLITATGRG